MKSYITRFLLILCCLASLLPATAQLSEGTYIFKSAMNPNRALTASLNGATFALHLAQKNNSDYQHFSVNGSGTVYIWFRNLSLTANGRGVSSWYNTEYYNGCPVVLGAGNAWTPVYSNGAYVFRCNDNNGSNYVLTAADNGNIVLWQYHGGDNQRWYLERVSTPANNSSSPTYNPSYPQQPTSYPCRVCNQTGRCSTCNGTGISPNHAPGIRARCGACEGTGRCATCHGTGYHN